LYSVLLEIQIFSHLRYYRTHPNIVEILGYDWQKDSSDALYPVVVVEYTPLGTLLDYLEEHGRELKSELKGKLCFDIAKGLHFVQNSGIAHGDVKLQNILVFPGEDTHPVAKISDFGHSRTCLDMKEPQRYSGTRLYVPLEAWDGQLLTLEQLFQCDIFAFGLAIWEILQDGKVYNSEDHSKVFNGSQQSWCITIGGLCKDFLLRAFEAEPTSCPFPNFYNDIFENTFLQEPQLRYTIAEL
ncbi:kinase-like domain-containing protein, partial [Amylocarpus encephaloides]